MIDFDEWAEELQNSKMDLIDLLQTHLDLIEENEKLKATNHKLQESIKHV